MGGLKTGRLSGMPRYTRLQWIKVWEFSAKEKRWRDGERIIFGLWKTVGARRHVRLLLCISHLMSEWESLLHRKTGCENWIVCSTVQPIEATGISIFFTQLAHIQSITIKKWRQTFTTHTRWLLDRILRFHPHLIHFSLLSSPFTCQKIIKCPTSASVSVTKQLNFGQAFAEEYLGLLVWRHGNVSYSFSTNHMRPTSFTAKRKYLAVACLVTRLFRTSKTKLSPVCRLLWGLNASLLVNLH